MLETFTKVILPILTLIISIALPLVLFALNGVRMRLEKIEVSVRSVETALQNHKDREADDFIKIRDQIQQVQLDLKSMERDLPKDLYSIIMDMQKEVERVCTWVDATIKRHGGRS